MSDTVVLGLRVVLSLGVVLLVLWLLARRLRGVGGSARQRPITVIARHHLSRRAGIAVVEVEGRRLLLGVADAGVSLMTELDPPEKADDDARPTTVQRPWNGVISSGGHSSAGAAVAPVPAATPLTALRSKWQDAMTAAMVEQDANPPATTSLVGTDLASTAQDVTTPSALVLGEDMPALTLPDSLTARPAAQGDPVSDLDDAAPTSNRRFSWNSLTAALRSSLGGSARPAPTTTVPTAAAPTTTVPTAAARTTAGDAGPLAGSILAPATWRRMRHVLQNALVR